MEEKSINSAISVDQVDQQPKPLHEEGTGERPFPVNVFPRPLQGIVTDLHRQRSFPVAFLAASILFVASVLLGSRISLITNLGRTFANLYIAIVAPQGADKSRPLAWACDYLQGLDAQAYEQYQQDLAAWRQDQKEGTMTPKPTLARYLMRDTTNEALIKRLAENPYGLGLVGDELNQLLTQARRYQGNDHSDVLLSLFSGADYTVDRKTTDEVLSVRKPFLSLIGTIQPSRFMDAFRGARYDSGLFARVLPVAQYAYAPKLWELGEDLPLDVDPEKAYTTFMEALRSLAEEGGEYTLSPEAAEAIQKWQNDHERKLNASGQDSQIAVFRKIQIYVLKFAPILQILWDVAEHRDNAERVVSGESALRATVLTDYFYATAIDLVDGVVEDSLDPRENRLMEVLPESFTAAEGLALAKDLHIGKTAYYAFLGKVTGVTLERTGRGQYKKIHHYQRASRVYAS